MTNYKAQSDIAKQQELPRHKYLFQYSYLPFAVEVPAMSRTDLLQKQFPAHRLGVVIPLEKITPKLRQQTNMILILHATSSIPIAFTIAMVYFSAYIAFSSSTDVALNDNRYTPFNR